MTERVLIQSVDHYEIKDKETGVINLIDQVYYFNDYREASDLNAGVKPMKSPCTPEISKEIMASLPGCSIGIFDIDSKSRPGAGGKPTQMIVSAKLVRLINLAELLAVKVQPAPKAVAA
ncbi:hypothetical protein [Paraherbaspirillum soli]|uniref:Uncharacterized protein n=1 Tax=Paraherbaspirillum soli TaxID=631222 RepID=A0ABW0MDD3_9BURK